MTSYVSWLQLAGPLLVCVQGTSTATNFSLSRPCVRCVCGVVAGRSQLLLPPFLQQLERADFVTLFAPREQPKHTGCLSQGPDESNDGGAPRNPCFSGWVWQPYSPQRPFGVPGTLGRWPQRQSARRNTRYTHTHTRLLPGAGRPMQKGTRIGELRPGSGPKRRNPHF